MASESSWRAAWAGHNLLPAAAAATFLPQTVNSIWPHPSQAGREAGHHGRKSGKKAALLSNTQRLHYEWAVQHTVTYTWLTKQKGEECHFGEYGQGSLAFPSALPQMSTDAKRKKIPPPIRLNFTNILPQRHCTMHTKCDDKTTHRHVCACTRTHTNTHTHVCTRWQWQNPT